MDTFNVIWLRMSEGFKINNKESTVTLPQIKSRKVKKSSLQERVIKNIEDFDTKGAIKVQ